MNGNRANVGKNSLNNPCGSCLPSLDSTNSRHIFLRFLKINSSLTKCMTNFDVIANVTAIHKNNNDELINNKASR